MTVAAGDIRSRKTLGIPLNATVMEILRAQIGKHDEFVFAKKGRRLNATLNSAWRNALKKSGIEDFRFHDTRHTWASLLIQNGVPMGMIKELGGWKSDSMVERYALLAPKHLARHAAVIQDLQRPGGERPALQEVRRQIAVELKPAQQAERSLTATLPGDVPRSVLVRTSFETTVMMCVIYPAL